MIERNVFYARDKDKYIEIKSGDAGGLPPKYVGTGPFTVEAWIRGAARRSVACITMLSFPGDDTFYALYLNDDRVRFTRLRVAQGAGGQDQIDAAVDVLAAETVTAWQWCHVAVTYQDGNVRIYLDGKDARAGDAGAAPDRIEPPENRQERVVIGGVPERPEQLGGQIAEVRIWSAARTQEQIAGTMACPPDLEDATLLGYWPLDDDSGGRNATIKDLSAAPVAGVAAEAAWSTKEMPLNVPRIELLEGGQAFTEDQARSMGAEVQVGDSVSKKLTIRNSGECRLKLSEISLGAGAAGAGFALEGLPALPAFVAPAGTVEFTLRFTPKQSGTRETTVTIASNDPAQAQGRFSFAVRGEAVPAPVVSAIGIAQYVTDEQKAAIPADQLRYPPESLDLGPNYVMTPANGAWPLLDEGRGRKVWGDFVFFNQSDQDIEVYNVYAKPFPYSSFRVLYYEHRGGKLLRPCRDSTDRDSFQVENDVLYDSAPGTIEEATIAIELEDAPGYELTVKYEK